MIKFIARISQPDMWSIINIETHNICNLRCKHCPYSVMTRPKEGMSPGLFRRIVDDANKMGIRTANLNIYGEPLLDPLLFDRVEYCKSRGLEVQFTSNGTLLDIVTIKRILETQVDRIYFSFDGATKETYEDIRRGASFEAVRHNIIRLWELRWDKPEIVVVMVTHGGNSKEVRNVKRMWKGLADKVQSWPMDNRKELGTLDGSKGPPCFRVFSELNVLSSGEVSLCCLDYDGKEVIGDLERQTIEEVWNSGRFEEAKRYHLGGSSNLIKLCKGCKLPAREKAFWLRKLCHI